MSRNSNSLKVKMFHLYNNLLGGIIRSNFSTIAHHPICNTASNVTPYCHMEILSCPERRLSTWHMIAASWLSTWHSLWSADVDLRDTTNIQQLWRQNFCSCWTTFVELFTSSAAQSRHHLPTVSTTATGTPFGNHGHGALWLLVAYLAP